MSSGVALVTPVMSTNTAVGKAPCTSLFISFGIVFVVTLCVGVRNLASATARERSTPCTRTTPADSEAVTACTRNQRHPLDCAVWEGDASPYKEFRAEGRQRPARVARYRRERRVCD
jgi:hypothetical protein